MAENEDRDRQSMGTSRPLSPYTLTYNNRTSIVQGTGADWFGPLNPMPPVAPPDVKGRILDYPSGYNLNVRPRAYEAVTFQMLRNFADAYDLLRLLIETRKDQMARLSWNVVPRDKRFNTKGATIPPEMEERIKSISEFLLMPDKENFWDDWLRTLLEDLFVIDAPTIYRRKTLGGELYALQPIDGGTIKRVIDDFGHTPDPPMPAYQQVLKGYSAVDYTKDELIYRPRVHRTHRIYGYSPVEQILMTVNIGMRRQIWQLQSFTEGNVPEALIGTPATWTPEQVRQFQDWFDSMLQGNTGERRRARFVPGDVAKGYIPTKPTELFGQAEEWLIRVMCYAFNVSPQPFVNMMNRATAESAQEVAAMEGLAPIQNWVRGLMNVILIQDFKSPDLEFKWMEEDELDPGKKSEIIDREQAAGRLTYNEARREQGLDPDPHPNADRPMFKTASGWVPIFMTPEEEAEKEAAAAAMRATLGQGEPEDGASDKKDEEAPGGDDGGENPPEGPSPAEQRSEIPSDDEEVAEKGDVPLSRAPGGRAKLDCGCESHPKLAKAGKADYSKLYADPLRPFAARKEAKLASRIATVLREAAKSVSKQVRDGLAQYDTETEEVAKAEYPDDFDIDAFIDNLDLDVFTVLYDELEDILDGIGRDAGRISLSQIGMQSREDGIVDRVNDRALNWAETRSAELVSFDEGTDPLLVAATRDMIRDTIAKGIEENIGLREISKSLEENYAFSDERASLIAATEITTANSMGALAGYKEAEAEGVKIKKSWLVLEDGCGICQENFYDGAIDLDETFSSGDDAPGAHPNCRCVLVPEVQEDEPEPSDDAEKSDFVDTLEKFAKVDNQNDMANYFPVDLSMRGDLWKDGGNNIKAVAERESSLLLHVEFANCVATQEYCDHDKVRLYLDDPTDKGFAPMVYQYTSREGDSSVYAIQDGHHRAVASRVSGNSGMSMNVKVVNPLDKSDQPRNLRGRFTSDPGESFMPGEIAGVRSVKGKSKVKIEHLATELTGDSDELDPKDDTQMSTRTPENGN